MQYTYEYNGQMHSISLEKQPDGTFRAKIGEREIIFTAKMLPDRQWFLQMGRQHLVVTAETEGDTRYIHVGGQAYTLNAVNAPTKRRSRRGAGGSDLTAQMPGQVREVRVAQGDSVKAGDTLVILEAMKMEIRVTAPADGTVNHLYVKAGDVVERGQRLVEIAEL